MRIRTKEDALSVAVGDADCDVPNLGSLVLPVPGAGHIEFGQYPASRCGAAVGMLLDVSWTKYGYSGGVMDRKDVATLRDYLTAWLDGTLEQITDGDEPEIVT